MPVDANDVYAVYGKPNIRRWADLDNNEEDDDLIDQRIQWAIDLATDYVYGRLINGPYEVPFDAPEPTLIIATIAKQAGIELYNGRQVVNASDPNQVTRQMVDVQAVITRILRGQLKLIDPSSKLELDVSCGRTMSFRSGDAAEAEAAESFDWENPDGV